MKIIYSVCAALVLSSFVSFASVAQAGPVNKPVTMHEFIPPVNHEPPVNHRVPEPATLILLGSGLFAMGAAKRLTKRD